MTVQVQLFFSRVSAFAGSILDAALNGVSAMTQHVYRTALSVFTNNCKTLAQGSEGFGDKQITASSSSSEVEKLTPQISSALLTQLSEQGYSLHGSNKKAANSSACTSASSPVIPNVMVSKNGKEVNLIDIIRDPEVLVRTISSAEEFDMFIQLEKEIFTTDTLEKLKERLVDLKKYYIEEVGLPEDLVDALSLVGLLMIDPYLQINGSEEFAQTPVKVEDDFIDQIPRAERVGQFLVYKDKILSRAKAFKILFDGFIPDNHLYCDEDKKRPRFGRGPSSYDAQIKDGPYSKSFSETFQVLLDGNMCMRDTFGPMVRACFAPALRLVKYSPQQTE